MFQQLSAIETSTQSTTMIEWLFVCYVFALFILPLPLWFLSVILLAVSCGGVEIGGDFNGGEYGESGETDMLISVISLLTLWILVIVMASSYEEQIDNEEDDVNNRHVDTDCDYLVSSDELEKVELELIDGNKVNSKWLVIDKTYVCHVNDQSCEGDVIYWECKRRRHDKCQFKCATEMDDKGKLHLIYMYSLDTHSCDQDKASVYNQIFRNRVKQRIGRDQRAKY